MIKLSKRLLLVASFVSDNSNIIDVGCDHAYLSIYLMETLKNSKIVASDINPNPLKIAEENIKKYGFQDKIKVELKDGITNLDKDIDTVIISGMGGILITKILDKNNLNNVKTLILSPNNDFLVVRKHLNKIGYEIKKEKIITENKITYLVLRAEKGKKKNNCLFGTLKNNDLETIYYFTKLLNNNTNILKKMPKKYIIKRSKIKHENKKIKKFLESC